LKYSIETENLASIWKRIKDKFKIFYNIRQVFCIRDYDILWFYRTDFFLFLYIYLFLTKKRKNNIKVYVQICQNSFGKSFLGRILNHFYYEGLEKADGVISTQKGLSIKKNHVLYIPDYYYDKEKYDKYQIKQKEEKAVCLGTMTPYKELYSLVSAFNKNGMPLEIKGFFYDKGQYEIINQIRKDNIIVEDTVLSEKDYYKTLAGAKYAVLPYDMNQYANRTSGVLQECLFFATIPVAPKILLEQNSIPGLGYKAVEELSYKEFFQVNAEQDLKFDYVLEDYNKEKVQEKVLEFFSDERNQ